MRRAAVIGGLLASLGLAAAAGRLPVEVGVQRPRWGGLQVGPATATGRAVVAAVTLAALLLLAGSAAVLLARPLRAGAAGGVALLWSLPILVGPPLLSLDVASYVAQGGLLQAGGDPTRTGVAALGGPLALAADPRWRAAPAPYGPLALAVSRLAPVHGEVGGVLVLRLAAAAAVAVTAALVATATRDRPGRSVLLVAGSPLALVALTSAAHWEALLGALAVGAVVAHGRDRRLLGYAAAAAAAAVKLPGAVVLAGLLATDLAGHPRDRLRSVGTAAVATGAVWGLAALVVPRPLGFLSALSTPGEGHTRLAPATVLGQRPAELLGAAVVVVLLLTVRARPLAATVGWGLLGVGLLGPVLYPWYLAPAVAVLALLGAPAARAVATAGALAGLALGLPRLGALPPGWLAAVLGVTVVGAIPVLAILMAPAGPAEGSAAAQHPQRQQHRVRG